MKTPVFSFLALILGIVLAGRGQAESLPPAEPVEALSPAYTRNQEMLVRVKNLLAARDTTGLEALAAELRASKDRLDGGTWLLSHFYDAAVALPKTEPEAGQALKFYETWAANRPQSITAQVCLAQALTDYAWQARGSGRADSVGAEQWKLFEERLDRAWEVLENAGELEEQCPGWFEAGQTVGLGQGWDREDYLNFVRDALAREPTYGRYYTKACYWLLPRWYGEQGDFEAWITEQAEAAPEAERDWQYARLVWMADRMRVSGEIVFAPGRMDWARTKRGFETWIATDPENLNLRFQFTRLALIAGDRETAREQFDVTGGKYFPRGWKNVEQFEQARRFAYDGGVNPLTAKEPPARARRTLPPETRERVEQILRVAGGFLGGALAGACLLALGWQRREAWAGAVALLACVLAGAIFGTLATILPAVGLYLYLRSKRLVHPPELSPPSGWLVLVWVIVLAGAFLLLQIGALILAMVPALLQGVADGGEAVVLALTRDGTMFRLIAVAGWLCFLGLLIACGPRNREDWQRKLGLHRPPWGSAVLWTLGLGALVTGVGFLADPFMDEQSRKSISTISEGIQSPFWFFLAVAVVAPIQEELLFRGYAFSGWVDKIGVWGAVFVPAVLFTVCHVQYGWVGLLYIFLMGVALGILRWKTDSVYPCLALHFLNNLAHCLEAAIRTAA
jgi:membrane protease YdiL (CAAX protease family)